MRMLCPSILFPLAGMTMAGLTGEGESIWSCPEWMPCRIWAGGGCVPAVPEQPAGQAVGHTVGMAQCEPASVNESTAICTGARPSRSSRSLEAPAASWRLHEHCRRRGCGDVGATFRGALPRRGYLGFANGQLRRPPHGS